VAIIEDPIPQLGELYPQPQPSTSGALWFLSAFDAWAKALDGIESALAAAGSQLGPISDALGSVVAAADGAIDSLASSPLNSLVESLLQELGQPNPVGSKIPWKVSVPQLPQETPYSKDLGERTRQMWLNLLEQLNYYLYGTPGPPPNL
jgi:hypothetical protein